MCDTEQTGCAEIHLNRLAKWFGCEGLLYRETYFCSKRILRFQTQGPYAL
jgi:hypothetical protein